MDRPNVILIMSDNQQAATLGCYGNPEIHSPHLDAMAAKGVKFSRGFCPNAFCSASRASVLTGRLPSDHGVHSWIDDRNSHDWPKGWHALKGITTLPEELKKLGYRTGHFGKYHLGESVTPGAGWDDWVTMEHGHVRSFYANQITDNGRNYEQPGHAVDFFTDKTLEFISAAEGPYFAYVPYPAPYGHWPATNDGMRNRYSEMYDDCPMNTVPRQSISAEAVLHYDQIKAGSGGGLDFSMLMRAPNHLPSLRNYYSQISLIDEAVGRIAEAAPDAIIIYTADHGLSLGHHGFWGHGASTTPSNLHLAAHSVPLIVKGPGVAEGVTYDRLVGNMDLYATILEAAGGEADAGVPSRSMMGALQGTTVEALEADEIFAEQEETRVLRTGRWAFFQRFRGDGAPDAPDALYDVEADPTEANNLATDPDYADVVSELTERIRVYFETYSRLEADLWQGGQPIQNSMRQPYWKGVWGDSWKPVYDYG